MHSSELASIIAYHRKRAGLNQIELARHAAVSRNVVQDLEAGKERASWRNLQAVLAVLNIRLEPAGPMVEAWRNEARQQEAGS